MEIVRHSSGSVTAQSVLGLPDGEGARACVLVLPDAFGLAAPAKRRVEMLTRLGYVALAVDLYGDGRLPADITEAYALSNALLADEHELERRIGGALSVLDAHPRADAKRVAVIGYCFGGTCALEFARSGAEIPVIVGFHSVLDTQRKSPAVWRTRKLLICTGALDHLVPPAQVNVFAEEMKKTGVDWQLHIYGRAVHNFTNKDAALLNRPGVAYDADADRRSWSTFQSLLREEFG